MRDYWLTQELLRAAGFGFLALSALGIGLALWLPKKWWGKLAALVVVGLLISIPVRQANKEATQQQVAVDEHKQRYAKAKALFDERCKTAGEKIHRTAEGVEGVLLMKLRPSGINYGMQFVMDDPYGSDFDGDAYIRSFLRGHYEAGTSLGLLKQPIPGAPPPPKAYLYVEAIDPKDGKRYRYTGGMKVVGKKDVNAPAIQGALRLDPNFDLNNYEFKLDKVPAPGRAPRYGVTYDDISTREEREYWIAGSSLKVIDLKSNEVMAERIGYMWDPGQGNDSGGRAPWLTAADHACPGFQRNPLRPPGHGAQTQPRQTLYFVEQVLNPKLEN